MSSHNTKSGVVDSASSVDGYHDNFNCLSETPSGTPTDSDKGSILIKATYNKIGSTAPIKKALKLASSANIYSKKQLLTLLSSAFDFNDIKNLNLERKSKRAKDYVSLETEEDFKCLKRSLKVKSHLKLIINDELIMDPLFGLDSDQREKTSVDSPFLATENAHREQMIEFDSVITSEEKNSSPRRKLVDTEELSDQIAEKLMKTDFFQTLTSLKGEARDKGTSREVHKLVGCNLCSPDGLSFTPIVGNRYNCLVCSNFDLCEVCQRKDDHAFKSTQHTSQHPMIQIKSAKTSRADIYKYSQSYSRGIAENPVLHDTVTCDNCHPDSTNTAPIKGTRYNCLICPDFDLCESCVFNSDINFGNGCHKDDHPMIQMREKITDEKYRWIRSMLSQRLYSRYYESGPTVFDNPRIHEDHKNSIHTGVYCHVCGASHIKGTRYKCTVCSDFELCEMCEAEGDAFFENTGHSSDHTTLKMRVASSPAKVARLIANLEVPPSDFHKENVGGVFGYDAEKRVFLYSCHTIDNNEEKFSRFMSLVTDDKFKDMLNGFLSWSSRYDEFMKYFEGDYDSLLKLIFSHKVRKVEGKESRNSKIFVSFESDVVVIENKGSTEIPGGSHFSLKIRDASLSLPMDHVIKPGRSQKLNLPNIFLDRSELSNRLTIPLHTLCEISITGENFNASGVLFNDGQCELLSTCVPRPVDQQNNASFDPVDTPDLLENESLKKLVVNIDKANSALFDNSHSGSFLANPDLNKSSETITGSNSADDVNTLIDNEKDRSISCEGSMVDSRQSTLESSSSVVVLPKLPKEISVMENLTDTESFIGSTAASISRTTSLSSEGFVSIDTDVISTEEFSEDECSSEIGSDYETLSTASGW